MQKNANKLQEFLDDRKTKGDKDNTIKVYKSEIRLFINWLGDTNIENITPALLREYLLNLSATRKSSFSAFSYIRVFLNWYWDEYEPETKNPIKKVKVSVPKINPKQPYSDDDIKRLLMVASVEKDNLRNTAIINLMLDTGLRSFELININIEDIDFSNNSIYIPKGKGGKTRVVLFGMASCRSIQAYLSKRKNYKSEDPLFIGICQERLNYYSLRRVLLGLCEKAKVDYKGLHSMRRKFCLDVYHNGMDLLLIQKLMGHDQLRTTQRYIKLDMEDVKSSYISPADKL